MPDVSDYFSDFFNGDAPADDYYIVFGLVGGLLLLCWTACCVYFCIDFGSDNVKLVGIFSLAVLLCGWGLWDLGRGRGILGEGEGLGSRA
jgi:hypothetical protein